MNYKNIITIEPNIRGGKPCIRGMRIAVYDVLEYLASGMSEAEILEDFPYLTHEDIAVSLAFAADRDMTEDIFLAKVIGEGERTFQVSRSEIFDLLDRKT